MRESEYTDQAREIHIERHQRYVEDGYCPAVHRTKAWCNRQAGHDGEHWAPGQGNEQRGSRDARWDKDRGCPCRETTLPTRAR